MTTQSPDQSLTQSQRETMSKQKHYVWMCNQTAGRDSLLSEHSDEIEARAEMMRLWSQDLDVWVIFPDGTKELPNGKQISREDQIKEREAPITQSPAPSKDMEECVEGILKRIYPSTERTREKDATRNAMLTLAAELGKEREAVEAFIKHVGANTFEEARDVLLRTKAQDEDKIEGMFNRNKELGRENAQLKKRIAELEGHHE